MKNKIIAVAFVGSLFSSAIFAHGHAHKNAAKENIDSLNTRTVFLEKQLQSLQNKIFSMENVEKKPKSDFDLYSLVEMYAHGPAVVTSPALGVRRSAEDASDLMVNLSPVNEDLVLLQLRQKMDNYAIENNILIPQRPIIALSGGIEGQVNNVHDYNKAENADVNLTRAEIDIIGEASPWATGAMIISYEDKGLPNDRRVNNSRIKIDRGFVTIGQLNKFPLYFTVGQFAAPFGSFGSDMITGPVTRTLGKVKDRMVVLGYFWNGLQAQAFAYPGEVKGRKNIFEHTGFNVGYDYSHDKFKIGVGASIIGSIAESDGFQDNIFAKNYSLKPNYEMLKHQVCGIDGRIRLSYHPFTVHAEYVAAAKRFAKEDVSFNNDGARPQAVNVEGVVEFDIMGKPNNFAIGYSHTWEALALNLPRDSFTAEYDIALIKNTILSFEYRHDVNYAWNDVASGRGIAKSDTVKVEGKGRHKNTITANLGIYF